MPRRFSSRLSPHSRTQKHAGGLVQLSLSDHSNKHRLFYKTLAISPNPALDPSMIKWKSQPSSGDKLKMEGNYDGILEEAVFGVSNDTIKWKSQPSSGDKLKMEGNTDGILEGAVFGASNDIDETILQNERCGICMDIIIDRGVLDCCNHWFCFACIDNWATITNLCPLCKNEFQLITCIPVYDTIGNVKVEEDSLSRDDDWCIQENNNTLSFPSYYIDEDAVICLDGDGCKIRNGLATTEEDITLDTSVACDSCDLWYHAFCVAFDPEITSQNSWLCPRCKIDEVPHKSDGVLIRKPNEQLGHENTNFECSTEAAFPGKLLVSVADAGETAVVVSMIEGKQWTESSDDFQSSILNVSEEEKPKAAPNVHADATELEAQLNGSAGSLIYDKEKSMKNHDLESWENSQSFINVSPQKIIIQPDMDENAASLALSLSRDASSIVPDCSLGQSDLKTCDVQKPSCSDEYKLSTPHLVDTFFLMDEPEIGSAINLHLGLCSGASFSVDQMANDSAENQLAGDQKLPLVELSLSDEMVPDEKSTIDANDVVVGVAHQESFEVGSMKRKYAEKSRNNGHLNDPIDHKERDLEAKVPTKKLRSDAKPHIIPLKSQVNTLASGGSLGISVLPEQSKDKLRQIPEKKTTVTDIMSIVKGSERRSSKLPAHSSSAEKSIKGDNVTGLRVKKIMRRVADDDSSTLLQKLRKEIREAIHDKTAKDGENNGIYDAQLLTAFRAVIARPENEPVKKINPSVVKAKKMILQKGKVRENLTRKLYGTSSGRRRRAWDRDWEIEFWKHRCTETQPQKLETLKSVLSLLKTNSDSSMESSKMELGPEGVAKNSILSRLYLADASVFPRKDDIKPLSVLNHEKNEEQNSSNASEKVKKLDREVETSSAVTKTTLLGRVPSSGNTGRGGSFSSLKGESTSKKVPLDGLPRGLNSISVSNGPKGNAVNTQSKESLSKSNDGKMDKRKWALEVLARKTASTSKDATKGNQEDETFKGNYPLLAELPTDMRPVLAPSRHCKIPMLVRQAQLYRITEHYLRKTNLPVMRRTADTELAVADAVNVEKDICQKSNSKLVYVNLCAQVISQISGNLKPKTTETTAATSLEEGKVHAVKNASSNSATTCEDVEEALKLAGLLSDSPPNSPYRSTNNQNHEDTPSPNVTDEDLVNVFDIDSHPELDIYGDFEYDLEDDDYAGPSSMANALRASKPRLEDGELKMKVVLSTINCEKAFNALDSVDDTTEHLNSGVGISENCSEKPSVVEAQMDSHSMIKYQDDGGTESSPLEVMTATPCLSFNPLQSEKDEELSLEECEELYGPDKEPLVNKSYDQPSSEPSKCMENDVAAEDATIVGNENSVSNKAAALSKIETESCVENNFVKGCFPIENDFSGGENSPNCVPLSKSVPTKVAKSETNKHSDIYHSITRKVEAYIKEHIRPLCKSGVITAEQYRWAVGKTTEKVMKYHFKDKNASFLIKEGVKVKKLAEQYVEAAQQKRQ